jgi:phosphopantetheine--protein transferase-like protein
MSSAAASTYIQKLTGFPVERGRKIKLSSLERARVAAWLRSEGIAFDAGAFARGSFSIEELLDGNAAPAQAAPDQTPPAVSFEHTSGRGNIRIGLDVQLEAKLPKTRDYREHSFFTANFTPAEIAYCIQSADPDRAFCGLWAAKEAILKAYGRTNGVEGLNHIEIGHDGEGKPVYAGGDLSISHSDGLSIAVFANLVAEAKPAVTSSEISAPAAPPPAKRWKYVLAGFVMAACEGGGLLLVLRSALA